MDRFASIAGALLMTCLAHAADGKPITRATLQSVAGATVASAVADGNGHVRFSNVPPGAYRIVLANADGRSVTVADLDGDGHSDIVIDGPPVPAGKVSVSSFNVMKSAPRDAASGLATGKRMHKPYCVLLDWDGTVKGGFASESQAQAEGQRLAQSPSGRCAVKVIADEQPGTIDILSWSWGASNSSQYVGTVTIVK